jgi:hypothetical protein
MGWQKAINAGLVTLNEARKREGYDPIEGGDQLLVNSAMIPISMLGHKQTQIQPRE